MDVAFDAIAGKNRGADGERFLIRRWGKVRLARFNHSVYGPIMPAILARA